MSGLEALVERFGAGAVLVGSGLGIGALFGFFAQRSRFCLRAASVEFATGKPGEKLAIWLLTFGSAFVGVQALAASGWLETGASRMISAPGSASGALVGGLCFGVGMVLARGCASRLLVLSATGNARALLAGLVFVVSAQAAWQGALEPLRLAVSRLAMIEGGPSRDLLARAGARPEDGLVFALIWLVAAFVYAFRGRVPPRGWLGGIGAGASVALAYFVTFRVGLAEFAPESLRGITFSGPSVEWLMRVLGGTGREWGFDSGLIPGVVAGAALGAVIGGEWKVQVFDAASGTLRYLFGAVLMGFGAMTAGGCAVGAGISGGAILSVTAWLALVGMWLGSGATHWLVDGRKNLAPGPASAAA